VVNRKMGGMNIDTALKEAMAIDGAVGVALVDFESGMSLGTLGGGDWLNLEVAAAGNTEVVRSKMRVMSALALNDAIEDILITLGRQYHLIRLIDNGTSSGPTLFMYLVLDRSRANLGLARHYLRLIEGDLTI
jgi:hypothetical protein